MKKLLCTTAIVIGPLMVIGALIYVICIAVMNPDMADMRLLMTFWREYIALFFIAVVGYSLTALGISRKQYRT